MRRRNFIAGLASTTAAWPLAAHAQRADQVRRIGVLMNSSSTDPEGQALLAEFTRSLAEFGWTEGRNVRIDVRWGASDVDRLHTFAKELIGLQPDVLLATSTPTTAALARETQTIPIVFALVADPITSRFVASLSHPGGNLTGFTVFEASIASKSLELLREIAPGIKRVAMMFNPDTAPFVNSLLMPVFETAAKSFNIAPIAAPVHSDAEIDAVINSLGREPGGALFGGPDTFILNHRATIISLAARNHLPAIYVAPICARDGGLVSYGADFQDNFRRSAQYVNDILRGAKPSELPVQMPVKYLLIINLKTAKALGITVPQTLRVAADEVIQ
jgi:putative tryptophan/tyrosine transport system substrate-binding protein